MSPHDLHDRLALPVIVAPMFLVSGIALTSAACRAGIVGSFPAANARTEQEMESWLLRLDEEARAGADAGQTVAPYAVNMIVRGAGTPRYEAELALLRRFRTPLVISSVGSPRSVVQVVHDYGGLVFHDVATIEHAEKAAAAGVDGLILLTAGAGGHTGTMNPFAFVPQVRRMFDGAIILSGAISSGGAVHAAEALGADFAYMGTRFAATDESLASPDYKALLLSERSADIMVTDRVSGLPATFMRGSLRAAGLDPDALPPILGPFQPDLPAELKAWRDIWSAGHGVGLIDDVPSVAALVDRLRAEYDSARSSPARRRG